MDAEENQMQVSLSAHSPWKSLQRFPHSHRRDDAVKSGKPKTGFPTFHCHGFLFGPNSERRPGGGASLLFQAHCSIRKCWLGGCRRVAQDVYSSAVAGSITHDRRGGGASGKDQRSNEDGQTYG